MTEKIRVFIVDDSIVARNILKMLLLTDEDIEIVGESGTGQGSIILLEDINPHIILLETNVGGGMTVIDVVREIKKFSENTKIILCTDSIAYSKVIPATDVGADDFISKPYKKSTLLRIIHELHETEFYNSRL